MAQTQNHLLNLLRAPKFGNPAKDRIAGLQHAILIGLLIAASLAIVIALAFGSRSWSGLGLPGIVILLDILTLSWQQRGHIEGTGWVLVFMMYGIFLFTFPSAGFTFTSALLLAIVISLAGLLLPYRRAIIVSLVGIATLWIVPAVRHLPIMVRPNELIYTSVIIGLETILLVAASRALEFSFAETIISAQNLTLANKDLQNLAATLEQRVEERTVALSQQTLQFQAATEVSRAISGILDADELVQKTVDLVRGRFELHYVGLFLLDEDERFVVLCASSGDGGPMLARLTINDETTIGWCINHRDARVAIANADLQRLNIPSELALPLIAHGEVVGAMMLQSDRESAFSPENITILQTMADQLANGIEKAQLYAQIQQRASELDKARAAADNAKEDADQARIAAEEANHNLAAQMWLTTGQAALNEKMRGEQDVRMLAENVIRYLCKYLKVDSGALYALQDDLLQLTATYAYRNKSFQQQYHLSEELVGQTAIDKEIVVFEIPKEYIITSLQQEKLLPQYWLYAPVVYNQQVSGVIALASMTEFTTAQRSFVEQAMESVAVAFLTAQARTRVDDLFAQTRRQAEELQAQEEELRAANEELETQTESLHKAKAQKH